MVSSAFFPILLAAICFGYLHYRRIKAAKAMDQAVQMVKLGLFGRLRYMYSRELLDGIEATLLAGAVTNFIFSEEPTEPRAWRFRAENLDRIESEARRLPQDGQLLKLIGQAVMAQATTAGAGKKQLSPVTAKRLQRLTDLGIPFYEIERPSPDTFIPAAITLYKASNALMARPSKGIN